MAQFTDEYMRHSVAIYLENADGLPSNDIKCTEEVWHYGLTH